MYRVLIAEEDRYSREILEMTDCKVMESVLFGGFLLLIVLVWAGKVKDDYHHISFIGVDNRGGCDRLKSNGKGGFPHEYL